jgi:hypothetical protein
MSERWVHERTRRDEIPCHRLGTALRFDPNAREGHQQVERRRFLAHLTHALLELRDVFLYALQLLQQALGGKRVCGGSNSTLAVSTSRPLRPNTSLTSGTGTPYLASVA